MNTQEMQTGEEVGAAAPVAAEVEQVQAVEPKEEYVPLSALQAERRERQQLQENVRVLQDHLSLMEARTASPQPQKQEPSYSKDDVMTYGEFERIMSKEKQQVTMSLDEMRVARKYKDYDEVVNKYLPNVLREKPWLRATLQNDPNRFELAYDYAVNSNEYLESKKETKRNAEAERIVQNSQKAGNLSSVGGTVPKGQVKQDWKSMSDAEFMKQVHRHMGHI